MNSVSCVFLDRRNTDVANDHDLLESIRQEMAVIHRYDLRYTFLLILDAIRWIPGLLRYSQRPTACNASAVLTNVGKLLRRCKLPRKDGLLQTGNLTILDIDTLAPIRANTSLTICIHEYNNQLKCNLQFDPQVIDRSSAERLIERFRERILSAAISSGARKR